MRTRLTPLASVSSAERTFGIMPPKMTPASINASACSTDKFEIGAPPPPNTAGTFVTKVSRSASMADATAAAT